MSEPSQTSLIDRAWQQLSKNQGKSLIERAVDGVIGGAASEVPDTAAVNGKAFDAVALGAGAGRRSQEFAIDLQRLAARGIVTPDSRSRLSEEVRLIKQRLMQRMRLFDQKQSEERAPLDNIIMITSARPYEGKSFVSMNLAMSFIVDEGLNVLLVDADPIQGTVLSALGVKAERGLIDLLKNPSLDMADFLLRDAGLRFSVLPGGSTSASATELFGSQRMRELMTAMATRYRDRIIIFDCPPVLASTEPLAIAQFVGQLLFVVEANGTPERAIRSALELLAPCRNVSLVLNKAIVASGADEFGSYYHEYDRRRRKSTRNGDG
jgi:exopolysaccharide/PEP-CTERM locus tyrosine autokinase